MGVFPEPARCADDVGGRVPGSTWRTQRADDGGTRGDIIGLPRRTAPPGIEMGGGLRETRTGRRCRRSSGALVLGLIASFGLPQGANAPAFFIQTAEAHDRIDAAPKAETALTAAPPTESRSAWNGLPLPEQDPPTTALIEDNLAALPRVTQEDGEDAVRFGQRRVPLKVVDTIVKASEEAGVDPVYMMALADKESSFDTDAKAATSSAQGLFQFVKATWLELIRDYGPRHGLTEEAAAVKGNGPAITVTDGMKDHVLSLRNDPRVAALMAAELIKRDRDRIEARVGRPLSTTELYLAHFLGTASAGKFVSLSSEKPDETAAKAFRSAARANRGLFTQKENGKRRHLTIAEFQNRIEDMIDERLARYRGVTAVAAAVEPPAAPDAEPSAPRRIEVTEALPPDGE